jgi:hypothetical protein
VNLSPFVTRDGVATNITTNNVDSFSIEEIFDAQVVGSYGSNVQLTMFRDDTDESDAFDLVEYGTNGFLIISRFGTPAATSPVEVYPSQFHEPAPQNSAANTMQTCGCRRLMTSLDELLADAENPAYRLVTSARVLLRHDLRQRHEEMEERLAVALAEDERENREPVAPDLARELVALEEEIEAAKVTIRFSPIGRRAWADLMKAHPPTKEQAKERLDHNPDSFPVAAIAASAIEPEISLDAAQRLERVLNDSQFNTVWAACLKANIGGVDVPKSRAAGLILRVNGASATTAALMESLDQSS